MKTLLSGMQPTGTGMLHLGNYEVLKSWVQLQNSGEYECFNCIVDWHALTADFDKKENMPEKIFNVAAEYIAAGLDPDKSVIFIQSDVKQHAELHLLLSMIVPVPWLVRVPSYKDKLEKLGLDSYGFLGYPILQAADIIVYKANLVPVGKDQLPHLEIAREIVRRFNFLYGDIFPEPQALESYVPYIPGTDNRKMGKSYNNYILMCEDEDSISRKIMGCFTDETKLRRGDPGHPDICPVYALLQIYAPSETDRIKTLCEAGDREWGCVKCKKLLVSNLLDALEPFRKRRNELLADKEELRKILKKGGEKASERAESTMREVRKAMKLW
jgi:tryptophanyl-tRNA synthetase